MKPLAVSTGDPGGVGPEVAVRAAVEAAGRTPVLLFGDAEWLSARAQALGSRELRVARAREVPGDPYLAPGQLICVDCGVCWDESALRHKPTAEGGEAQLRALDVATELSIAGQVRALVTAPMSKEAVTLSGAAFTGHTEHLARAAGLAEDAVTMMFLGPRLRVALVTTHVAIAELPDAITQARVERTIAHLAEATLRLGGRAGRTPAIVVAGMNPHASEHGLFGSEERLHVEPAVERLQAVSPFQEGRLELRGPIGAETAFRLAAGGEVDGVVAMMHDQATIASKILDWTQAVNVTWGLPFVRTSVDHGVAYDAAAKGEADPRGMLAALEMALELTR